MRTEYYRAEDLAKVFRTQKIATMAELKDVLGSSADITIFRKLTELSSRTSYSHRGRFYTLADIPDYDAWGLWSYRSVWFSRRGTLLATAEALVQEADAGFFVAELEGVLNVEVKGALLRLVRQQKLARASFAGRYLYCSPDTATRDAQLTARRVRDAATPLGGRLPHVDVLPDELKASIVLFFSLCSMSNSDACTPAWSRSRWATEATRRSPTCWGWTRGPWPAGGTTSWTAM
jgi:hypothetical protein